MHSNPTPTPGANRLYIEAYRLVLPNGTVQVRGRRFAIVPDNHPVPRPGQMVIIRDYWPNGLTEIIWEGHVFKTVDTSAAPPHRLFVDNGKIYNAHAKPLRNRITLAVMLRRFLRRLAIAAIILLPLLIATACDININSSNAPQRDFGITRTLDSTRRGFAPEAEVQQ